MWKYQRFTVSTWQDRKHFLALEVRPLANEVLILKSTKIQNKLQSRYKVVSIKVVLTQGEVFTMQTLSIVNTVNSSIGNATLVSNQFPVCIETKYPSIKTNFVETTWYRNDFDEKICITKYKSQCAVMP